MAPVRQDTLEQGHIDKPCIMKISAFDIGWAGGPIQHSQSKSRDRSGKLFQQHLECMVGAVSNSIEQIKRTIRLMGLRPLDHADHRCHADAAGYKNGRRVMACVQHKDPGRCLNSQTPPDLN